MSVQRRERSGLLSRRWWDVAVPGTLVTVGILAFVVFGPNTAPAQLAIICSLVLFALAYVLFARPEISEEPSTWRAWAFLAAALTAMFVGILGNGFMAMLQALAYPLVWIVTDDRKRAIIACAAIAVTVGAAIVISNGFTPSAWVSGLATAGLSLVFTIAFGLWIANIAEYGEDRARLVAELTAAQAQVEALSRERGAADERERLARDIHDTLAQTLAGLVILAERAGLQSRNGQTDAAARTISTVEDTAREALAEARALVARTAAVPSEPAFGAAAARLVERFRAEAGFEIGFDDSGVTPPLARETQVVLLRCAQEALANVRKHAGATRADVRVATTSVGGVELEVSDDGRGFDALAARTGFGLDGMSERVALAGGVLDIASDAGEGTVLRITLPAAEVDA